MTKFRTKGKGPDRRVYPVGKRKSYGVNRELAYKEVEALRVAGERARLIETNRQHKLYAPYESMLKSNERNEIKSDIPKIKANEPVAIGQKREELSNDENKSKIELSKAKKDIESSFDFKNSEMFTYSKDGNTYVTVFDKARVIAVFEQIEGEFPDLGPVKMRLPKLDLDHSDTDSFSIDAPKMKEIFRMSRDVRKITKEKEINLLITFESKPREFIPDMTVTIKPDHGIWPDDTNKPEPVQIMIADYHSDNRTVKATFNFKYFHDLVKSLNNLQRKTGKGYFWYLKDNYPLLAAGGGFKAPYRGIGGMVAPRVE